MNKEDREILKMFLHRLLIGLLVIMMLPILIPLALVLCILGLAVLIGMAILGELPR